MAVEQTQPIVIIKKKIIKQNQITTTKRDKKVIYILYIYMLYIYMHIYNIIYIHNRDSCIVNKVKVFIISQGQKGYVQLSSCSLNYH